MAETLVSGRVRRRPDPDAAPPPPRRPFWNDACATKTRDLWWPSPATIDDKAEPGPTLKPWTNNSWFTVKVLQDKTRRPPPSPPLDVVTLTQARPKTRRDGAELKRLRANQDPETLKPKAGWARRVRVFPTTEQKVTLRKWLGAVRWTYNQAVDHINRIQGYRLPSWTVFAKDMRARFANEQALKGKKKREWALKTPFDVRDGALQDLYKGISSNIKKLVKTPVAQRRPFRMKRRKDEEQSLVVHAKHWGVYDRGAFASVFSSTAMVAAEPLPDTLDYDGRLVVDRTGRWYMCFQELPRMRTPLPREGERVIALDPGCRKFMTGFDPQGAIYEWGSHDDRKLLELCKTADRIQRKLQAPKTKGSQDKCVPLFRRNKVRRALLRVHDKVRNRVKDLHCKLAKWLCANYDTIVLPTFETRGMTERRRNGKRRLHSKTARGMYTWSHYLFRQRLEVKANEFACKVEACTEEYTSKTCGQCGRLTNVGGSEKFRCRAEGCGAEADRDANGARNILLKWECC
jgi:putative transposase